MSFRRRNHEQPIVSHVIAERGSTWSEETQKVASTDSQRILEALIAEFGVEKCQDALDNQGFRGSAYRYLLNPIHQEAERRRSLYLVAGDEQGEQ